jgi:recombinational DNA repair protein (RecF pathway)
MSYHIYTTNGIILKRTGFGEANILLYVLTEDLGLIIASARSARLSVSKLRPALQEYSYVSLSCVKGKNGWKITNVAGAGNLYFDLPKQFHVVLARISGVLLKMITGEHPHPEIFHTVREAFFNVKNVSTENLQNFETLLVLRILFELGYVAKNPEIEKFLSSLSDWSEELLTEVGREKLELIGLINNGLRESHL